MLTENGAQAFDDGGREIAGSIPGKAVTLKAPETWNGKTVPAFEYTVEYEGSSDLNAFNNPGSYNIKVTGKKINFRGSLLVKKKVTEKLTAKNLRIGYRCRQWYNSVVEE